MAQATIGVIGGSGLYEMEGLKVVKKIDTPFGKPSDEATILKWVINRVCVRSLTPHEVPGTL